MVLALAVDSARAGTYVWEMDATEDQVNNCASPPAASCAGDGSTDSTATGHGLLVYDTATDTMSWTIDWSDLGGLLSAIHIHGPASPAESVTPHLFNVYTTEQDVIDAGVNRTTDSVTDSDLFVLISRTSGLTRNEVVQHMLDEQGYLNIHSTDFPAGEIRANLILTDVIFANVTKNQQTCANALTNAFAKVAKKQGKEILNCIKDAGKGKPLPAPTIDLCLEKDPKAKVAGAKTKTTVDFAKKCSGIDKDAELRLPLFGGTTAAVINTAAVDKELWLIRGVFGPTLEGVIDETNSATSRCQTAVAKAVQKCQGAQIKGFRKCKKDGLEGFGDATDLEGCIGDDPSGKIAGACHPTTGKIAATVLPNKCGGVDLLGAFPGCGTADAATLAQCLDQLVACHVCEALNTTDGLGRDCDAFAGASCG
jgi:hypothetical protein